MAMNYSKILDRGDIEYLSTLYDIEPDLVASFDDDAWCDFLSCEKSDLAFLLFGDETYVDPTLDELMALEEVDIDDWDSEEDFYLADAIAPDYNLFGEVVNLEKERTARNTKKRKPQTMVYSRPAWANAAFGKPKAKPKIEHYFRLVN